MKLAFEFRRLGKLHITWKTTLRVGLKTKGRAIENNEAVNSSRKNAKTFSTNIFYLQCKENGPKSTS